jgi:hypothetical protein
MPILQPQTADLFLTQKSLIQLITIHTDNMKAHSFSVETIELLTQQLDAKSDYQFEPTLALVFCSPNFDLSAISTAFAQRNIDLLGCTTAGEINNDVLTENTISVMLLDVSQKYFKLNLQKNESGITKASQQLRAFADQSFEKPAMIVVTSGVLNDGEAIVEGLKMGRDREIPIFGGLSGDDLRIIETSIFTHETICPDGVAAIIFNNEKVEITGLATSGWQTLGAENTVTKAEGNVIHTINNEPALDYFIRFFGSHDDANVKNKPISSISAQYPFQVIREDGYAVLRSPILGDYETGSLRLVGKIKEGDRFRFSISPGVEVIEKTVEEFDQFSQKMPETDALILFSCKGRHAALGPFLDDEVKGIYDKWQKPMTGFLSYGEIGHVGNGVCEFHNETCSLVLIREKNPD